MNIGIYYTPQNKRVTITNNFAEILKSIESGITPKNEYVPITILDVSQNEIRNLNLEGVDNTYFRTICKMFKRLKLETLLFCKSRIDLENTVVNAHHIVIADQSKITMSSTNLRNVKEISLLSLRTLKVKLLDQLTSVEKVVLRDTGKAISLLERFPNLKELTINRGIVKELDLRNNLKLEKLTVHYCGKLEQIYLSDKHNLSSITIYNCKKLAPNNLPVDVVSAWPL